MDWMGIGVLVIGIAFAVLVIILIKPVRKLGDVLEGVEKTTNKLPDMLDDLTKQTSEVMHSGNSTIRNVNGHIQKLNPLFEIVEDTGQATRQLTLSALEKTNTLKAQTSSAATFTRKEKYEGIYGIISFIFFLSQRKKEIKKVTEEL
ncbi:DUF948 domain-containing protein [Sporosarcina oncorhynchi]|uniref:DUF948 domain-containing protein n=1 Tax=Sporosarcina oncorhynchi TaxID=3056444 RepID=A0ABZ0L9Y0_9BACL|nr:DUF948 domain-containing protein [Sporosarcina sp. T2O-4]WOV88940.1 DUF948 domain-containing protein [Sporosarcina sp. T2O-4]